MSLISRRQKELLLNDVARMINNNNHTAFANHAKEAESISNGELKLYIDSPKKEFVIKSGKKEIRFNCSEQNIKELSEIKFNNDTSLKGVSDELTLPSSTIALSTKGGQQIKQSIDNKADKEHTHDNYADKEHTHDNDADKEHTHDNYADKEHIHDNYADKTELTQLINNKADILHDHPEYQPIGDYATKDELLSKSDKEHTHDNYAEKEHTHDNYADKSHTHDKYADKDHTHYGIDSKDDLEEFIKDVMEDPWYVKLFHGLEVCSDVYQYGLIAGMQAQILAIHSALAANSIVDGIQTTSSLGTCLNGFASKIKGAADTIKKIGNSFDSIKEPIKKILEPINKVANKVEQYSKIVDNFSNCESLDAAKEMIRRAANGAPLDVLPEPSNAITKPLLS